MTSVLANAAIAIYLLAFGYQVLQLRKQINTPTLALQLATALAIVLHSQAVADFLFSSEGLSQPAENFCTDFIDHQCGGFL